MQEINLLKTRLADPVVRLEKRNRILTTLLAVILILELAAGGIFFFWRRSLQAQLALVGQENVQIQSELRGKEDDLVPAQKLQAQLKNLNQLLDAHVYWTKFLDELGSTTLKTVQYTQLQTDTTYKVYLEGIVDTYSELGKVLLALTTSQNFDDVRLLSSAPNSGEASGITFTSDFTLDPQLIK